MRFNFTAAALLLIGGLAASTAAFAADSGVQPNSSSDQVMAREVETQITTTIEPADPISVHCTQNIVTLHGFVDSEWDKQRAEEAARKVPGVQGVRDELTVNHVVKGSHQ
jgi:osmotically-inducible protein OsmY